MIIDSYPQFKYMETSCITIRKKKLVALKKNSPLSPPRIHGSSLNKKKWGIIYFSLVIFIFIDMYVPYR